MVGVDVGLFVGRIEVSFVKGEMSICDGESVLLFVGDEDGIIKGENDGVMVGSFEDNVGEDVESRKGACDGVDVVGEDVATGVEVGIFVGEDVVTGDSVGVEVGIFVGCSDG